MANEQKKYEISNNKEYFYMAFLSQAVLPLLPKELDYLWVLFKISRHDPIPVRDADVINAIAILIEMEILESQSLTVAYPVVSSSFVSATVDYEIQTREVWYLMGAGVYEFAAPEAVHHLIAFLQTKLHCGKSDISADVICTLFGDDIGVNTAVSRLMSTGHLTQSFGGFCIESKHRAHTASSEWEFVRTTRNDLFETARNAYLTDRQAMTTNSPVSLLSELVLRLKSETIPNVSASILGTSGLVKYFKNPDVNHLKLVRDAAFLHERDLLALDNDGVYLKKELVDYMLAPTVGASMSEVEKEEIEELKGRVSQLERALKDAILLITEMGERQESLGDGRVYCHPHPGPDGRRYRDEREVEDDRNRRERSWVGRHEENRRLGGDDCRDDRDSRHPRYLERIRREDERRRGEDNETGGGHEFRNFVHRRDSFRDDSFRHGREWDRTQSRSSHPISNVAAMREGLERARATSDSDHPRSLRSDALPLQIEDCNCMVCINRRLAAFTVLNCS